MPEGIRALLILIIFRQILLFFANKKCIACQQSDLAAQLSRAVDGTLGTDSTQFNRL
jgi:hypothetical protein